MAATVSLRAIVSRTDLGLRSLTGSFDDRAVRWVHICELPDPALYLTGQELLLTAGVDFPTADGDIDDYVARLVGADTAALGFGVTPVYDEVPSSLVDSCRRHGLPLLEVPEQVSFLYISQTVSLMLAAAEQEGLRRLSTAQRVLTRAAARPDGIEAVVRQLATQLRGWAVLTDGAGQPVASAGRPARLAEVARLTELVRRPGGPASATTHLGDAQVVVQRYDSGTILIAGRSTAFGPSDRAVLSVGGALLTLLTSTRWQSVTDTTTALLTVLSGGVCGPVEELLAGVVARPPETDWRVIMAVRKGKRGSAIEVANRLGTPLVASTVDGGVLAVVPAADAPPELGRSWLSATSAPVPLRDLASAVHQANRLLAEVTLDGHSRVADTPSTLDSLVEPVDAASFARRVLGPLTPDLLDTLRCWLAHNGNWESTAVALDVHRNTVRHRVSRIAALLDRDLDNPDLRAELWLALRWATSRS